MHEGLTPDAAGRGVEDVGQEKRAHHSTQESNGSAKAMQMAIWMAGG